MRLMKMKHLGSGNDAVDLYANHGRAMHPNVSELIIRTQARFNLAKHWVTWIAHAASLQVDKDFNGCDHDLRDKDKVKAKGMDQRVRIPDEATVLRRMPWAATSFF